MLILILLPVAFLLPPGAGAGEIVRGREAQPHSRPYMAYLDIKKGNYGMCGGFLVSENFVLTAAHCNGEKITVILGAHNIKSKRERADRRRKKIPVSAKIPHMQYVEETDNNDIMLLQLKRKVKLNKWVKTIPLPDAQERITPGTNCSVAGWGMICPGMGRTLDTLQEVDVEVLKNDTCQKYRHYNPTTMLCAGDPRKGKDSAQGDSGGPLVCEGTVQGIVSWGPSTPPGVYTRVSTFVPWIEEQMKKLQP
ncbi:mast cell protease 1A-like [Emydura macquarii macquarii]|uniref:mast cell protease 1A-like n=1 Tax=Emydura macquarii macquarii TaxID=1129001 RepID=UPI00352A8E7C